MRGERMSTLNDLVYRTTTGKTGTSLDQIRNDFYGLYALLDVPDSQISVKQSDRTLLFHSGYDFSFVNQLATCDEDPEKFEDALTELASWNIKCSVSLSGPALVHGETLRQRGFTADGAVPLMAYAIDDSLNNFELRTGLRAERTTSSHNYQLNIDMIVKTFGMAEETAAGLLASTIHNPNAFRYILFDGDTPVSSSVFLTDGYIAGCFDVVTPPEHQRKGYAEELMKFMVKEQAALGRQLIVLQSSDAGQRLYRRMGYQVIDYAQMWLMANPVRLTRFEICDITVGKYRLRQLTEDDEELILENFADEAFQRWMGMPIPFLKQDFLNFLAFSNNQYKSGLGVWWVIEEDGIPMGQIWIMFTDWIQKKTEIGYLAYAQARGKGMIPFLARELAKKLLLEYKFERVELTTHTDNETSGHVARKAGFIFEATNRRKKIYRGEVIDFNMYSMIASDLE
jgi:RimJ/RimL family protein N-acetyltransferase/GNAT superfamily N-acetyltransferase